MYSNFLLEKSWPLQLILLFTILSTRAFILAGGSALWTRFSKWAQSRQIMAGERIREKMILDVLNALKILLIDSIVAVIFFKTGFLHFEKAAGALTKITQFAILFVWVEIYFYYSHKLLHKPKLFWIHRHHHQANLINPWSSLSFSALERLILLFGATFIPAVVSFWFPLSFEVYAGYFFMNYVLNVHGHLNVETYPVAFVKSVFGKVWNTTTYHTLHHMRYKGHYGLFTSVLDRVHGTWFKDYEAIHAKNFVKQEVPSLGDLHGVTQ
ncbi:MAG: sterol desaturase family protein [Pseudobdellovibrio sp.]